MKAIRLGNDIEFVWTVEGLTSVIGTKLVQLFNVNKGIPETMTYEISGDNISGLYKGKDQKEKGSYRLILYVNRGENDMVTLDCVNVFELVGVSNFGIVNGSDESAITIATINLRSTLDAAPVIPSFQAQADWEQDDNTKVDFIKNKPTLFSGDYEDLTNKPTIPDAQIQSDWNQSDSTKKDYIKNKPDVYEKPSTGIPSTDLSSAVQTSLGKADTALQTETDPTVPSWAKASSKPSYTASEVGALPDDTPLFSGDYNDLTNKPTIPAAQVQSDWNATTGMGVILNKPTIPTVPTNVSAFINDAGYLTSHQDISGKEDKVTIESASGATLSAEVGKYYTLSSVGTLAITLPTIASGTTKVQTVTFYIAAGSTPAVTFTSTHSIYYSDGFEIAASSTYEVSAAYNGIAWVVASVKIVIPT